MKCCAASANLSSRRKSRAAVWGWEPFWCAHSPSNSVARFDSNRCCTREPRPFWNCPFTAMSEIEAEQRVVLIVDDDDVFRNRLCRAMEARGWQSNGAADGTSALEMAANSSPDLAIVDLRL